MPPDLSADAIRNRSFPGAMRGYDKDAVDAFRDDVADRLAELETRLGSLESRLAQLGIEEPIDLEEELKKVAGDLASIMDEARRAATDMRERASLDAARVREETEASADALRAEAQTDAEALRGSAWELATAVLESSRADAEQTLEAARQDALFIRAEAERAEMRAGTEARRAAEDMMRSARTDAERMAREARAESERVLEAARKSAEIAQERARALEDRRSELLRELEATRRSIDELESQMDVATAGEAEAASSGGGGSYQPDPSVRVIPAQDVIVPGAVDADEMAAEVENLRRVIPEDHDEPVEQVPPPSPVPSTEPTSVESGREPQPEEGFVVVAGEEGAAESAHELGDEPDSAPVLDDGSDIGDEAGSLVVDELVADPDSKPGADASDSDPVGTPDVGAAVPSADTAMDGPTVPASPEESPQVRETTMNGARPATPSRPLSARPAAITDLFASLRSRDVEGAVAAPSGAAEPSVPSTEHSASPAATPPPEPVEFGTAGGSTLGGVAMPTSPAQGALELRDRLLLPSQNQALRTLKRAILDLQNGVLESIRLSEGQWTPDRSGFAEAVTPPVGALVAEAFISGHEAAAELAGRSGEVPPVGGEPTDRLADVADAMLAAVEEAFQHGVARSAGQRELSAAVSRVFRAWRTDEAERQLRTAAYHAYHEGVMSGLAQLGISEVVAVSVGKRCADCPAASDRTWNPSGAMPPGVTLPPAHPDCVTTVVPALGAPIGVSGGKQRDLQ